jgi:hypothetical protein
MLIVAFKLVLDVSFEFVQIVNAQVRNYSILVSVFVRVDHQTLCGLLQELNSLSSHPFLG